MKRKKIFIITLWALAGLLVVIQFVPIDRTNPVSDEKSDFITINNMPPTIASQLMNSCYDCHSNQTVWPWYSRVAPVSFIIRNHVSEGRRHLNFSTWDSYSFIKQQKKLDGCVEMIQEGEMPLAGYVPFHPKAKLTGDAKEELINWLKSQIRKPE